MKPLRDLTPGNTWANTHRETSGTVVAFYDHHRQLLQEACADLQVWDEFNDNFFSWANHSRPLRQLTDFATAPANRTARGAPAIAAAGAVLVGGAVLIKLLANALLGSSGPSWEQKAATCAVANAAEANAKYIEHIAARLGKTYYFDHFHALVDKLCTHAADIRQVILQTEVAIAELQESRVHPLFINNREFRSAIRKLRDPIADAHLHPAVKSVADLRLLPAFGIKQAGILQVVVPVPAIKYKMDMFRFAGTPLFIYANGSHALFAPRPRHTAIAVSSSSDHILLQQRDLARCVQIRSTYMCSSLPVSLVRHESCLGALFSADANAIHAQCRFARHHQTWAVAHADDGNFVITSTKSLASTISCLGHASSAAQEISWGTTMVHVPAGCTVQTRHFTLNAPRSSLVALEVHKQVAWNMMSPLNWTDATSLHLAETSHAARINANSVRAAIEEYQKAAAAAPGLFTWLTHLAAAASPVVLGCLILTIYCKCCRHRQGFPGPATNILLPQHQPPPVVGVAAYSARTGTLELH